MNTFIYRFKLFLIDRKFMNLNFLYRLTMRDIGKWFFKVSKNCVCCGSLNVVGVKKSGLYCSNCENIK